MGRTLLVAIAEYHNDVIASLELYFTDRSPDFVTRFSGYSREDLRSELSSRLEETDLRSALEILTRLEAAFRIDFEYRCQKKLKDVLSRAFRGVRKHRRTAVRLDEDIFETWKQNHADSRKLIGELRGAFRFRDWLAHGRYWEPKLGRKYDFDYLYGLADNVFGNLLLHEGD